ncbi:MAG: histidine kinase, partial [Nocardioides sp.]
MTAVRPEPMPAAGTEVPPVSVDPFKLVRWMNARKLTAAQTADRAGLDSELLAAVVNGQAALTGPQLERVSDVLLVSTERLLAQVSGTEAVVVVDSAAFARSRRPIKRAGIDFYNYYSLAGPVGRVAPVVLDILCPADLLPELNNGHLEPAITVNIGPGDIHGRWAELLERHTWQVLGANPEGPDSWICGDSYVEPSFCPHTYSLATSTPARIVSYTAQSNLQLLLEEVNTWDDARAARLTSIADDLTPSRLFDLLLARRYTTRVDAADAAGVSLDDLEAALADPRSTGLAVLRSVGSAAGIDYRLLLPAANDSDAAGKTSRTVTEALALRGRFRGYDTAPMATSARLPDLVG